MTRAFDPPSPKTVCVPRFHRSQARQSVAAARNFGIVGLDGMSGAAVFSIRFGIRLTTVRMFGYKGVVSVLFMQSRIQEGFALSRSRSARARLESALSERVPSPFTDPDRRVCESVPTGIAPLDALTGGLPR